MPPHQPHITDEVHTIVICQQGLLTHWTPAPYLSVVIYIRQSIV